MFPQREGRMVVPSSNNGCASLHKRTGFGPFSSISLPNGSEATHQGCNDAVCRCSRQSCNGKLIAPWIDRVWRNVLGSLSRLGSLKQLSSEFKQSNAEGKPEVELLVEKASFKRRFWPKGKKEMSPLESHLLMVMLTNSFEEDCALGKVKLHCKCQDDAWTSETSINSDRGMFPMGVFLQPHPLEISKIAPEMTLRKDRQISHKHNSGFARLKGEPLMNVPNHFDSEERIQVATASGMHASGVSQRILPVQSSGPPLMALMELLPQITLPQKQPAFPDKEKLNSMQDFFLYTETEGRRVFEELDRDNDGKVTSEDLKFAMKRMKLPLSYADKFMHSTHKHWLSKSFGWSEFSSIMLEKEPVMIGLFNSLSVSKSGTVQRSCVAGLLKRAGLSATEADVSAMMKLLGTERDSCIKYGQFRKFMLLLPTEQLISDPWGVWFKAAMSRSDPSCQAFQDPVTLLSRGIVNQFKSVKDNAVVSNLQKAANLPDFVRFNVKNFTKDPIFRVGADALEYGGSLLSSAAAEVSGIRHLGLGRRNVISPVYKDRVENENSQSYGFDGSKHDLAQQ